MVKLLDIVLGLYEEDRRAVSSIRIERAGNGEWQARLNICRKKFDAGRVGAGVSLMAWERVPDQCYPLDIDELERDKDILVQARTLEESGLIGKLDMVRFDSEDGRTSYLIKSHAGSQHERDRWLMGLRERPENTLYLNQERD